MNNFYDEQKTAVINPCDFITKIDNFPKIGVACFSSKIIDNFIKNNNIDIFGKLNCTNGDIPLYKYNYNGIDIIIFKALIGSSACISQLEELIAMGLEKIVLFGTCGVLSKDIKDLSILIPELSYREEGTSLHYIKDLEFINQKEECINSLESTFKRLNISYLKGKNWTTDAIYRETQNKVNKYKEKECISVEMESSAIFALALFRNIYISQFLYAADNLDTINWDKRSLYCEDLINEKEKLMTIALECALELNKITV